MSELERYEAAQQRRVATLLAKKSSDLTPEEGVYLMREIRQYLLSEGKPSVTN